MKLKTTHTHTHRTREYQNKTHKPDKKVNTKTALTKHGRPRTQTRHNEHRRTGKP